MPSAFARTILFLSGYVPLFLIFTIQYYPRYGRRALIPFGIGVAAAIGLAIWLRWVKTSSPRPLVVQTVQRKDAEVIAYIFAYVFPFLGLNVEDPASTLGLAVFFIVLMILNVSSNMIHINPALNIIGYHVYEISADDQGGHTLITRRKRLIPSTELKAVRIGDDLWMEK